MHDSERDSPLRRKPLIVRLLSPRVGIPLALILLLLFSAFAYRASRVAGLPDIGDPFDKTAFLTLPPEENAFTVYRRASDKLVDPDWDEFDAAVEHGWGKASPATRLWLEDNAEALDVWMSGTRMERAVFNDPHRADGLDPPVDVRKLRAFARLCQLEFRRAVHAGDVERAWEVEQALFRFGRHCRCQSSTLGYLAGIGFQSIATRDIELWSRDSLVTTDHLRKALAMVESTASPESLPSVMMKLEYIDLQRALKHDEWQNLVKLPEPIEDADPWLRRTWLYFENEPEVTRRLGQHVIANLLSQVDRPLRDRVPRRPQAPALFEQDPTDSVSSRTLPIDRLQEYYDRSLLAPALITAYDHMDEMIIRAEARQRALTAALAVQLFRRSRSRLPETLAEVVPENLSSLPEDPFDRGGGTIRYRRIGEAFVVYSIGPNGVDDFGDCANPVTGDVGFDTRPRHVTQSSDAESPYGDRRHPETAQPTP